MELVAFVFAVSVPGATVLLFLWAVHLRRSRQRFAAALEAHACRLCGASFADALVDDLGRPSPAIRRRLDAFQLRFAHRAVRCEECGGVNICTRDGIPFKGLADA